MYRTKYAFLFMVAIMSVAAVAPSMGRAQGSPVNLSNDPYDDWPPVWSPDGSKIAFASNRDEGYEIYVMNANGDNLVRLTRRDVIFDGGPDGDITFDGYYEHPAWSPDGTKIAFATNPLGSPKEGYWGIYVMNADGTNLTELALNDSDGEFVEHLVWSPDGTKIAFEQEYPITGTEEIFVINADGTNPNLVPRPRRYLERFGIGPNEWPPWSSSGYTSLVPLTLNLPRVENTSPAWSPDGTKIAFTSDDDDPHIYVMNADGTNFARLTQNFARPLTRARSSVRSTYRWWSLAWSPDGTKIAFLSSHDGDEDIYVIPYGPAAPTPPDHGDTRERATVVHSLSSAPGALGQPGDVDYFRLELDVTEAGTLSVWTTGATDTVGYLQDQEGRHLAGDDDAGSEANFEIDWDVVPGSTYYVAVVGGEGRTATGAYTLELLLDGVGGPGPAPEYGNARAEAAPVGVNTRTSAALERAGDVDYFRVDVTQAGRLTVETTGTTDTFGYVGGASGGWLAQNDDGGTEYNFRITRDVMAGTYYVAVVGYNRTVTGAYTLRIAFTPAEGHGNTERGDRRATLLNLSPWQAWVHLYCLKDRGTDAAPCAVTFECNGQSGEPVTWPVTVAPKTIFSYWPNKTAPDGTAADLQAALIAAGKPEDEARRRTTCEVFSADPLTVRGYTLFGGQPTLVPVAEPARPDVAAAPGEPRLHATLPNLSPGQAWVHLYCLKDRGTDAAPCAVTFECNGQSGEPVTWPVEVGPKTIFSYWPNKTVGGLSADLQAALIAAGKPEDEARRRTTCEVFSADPIAVRGYTRFGGQPTLVPVTAYPLSR